MNYPSYSFPLPILYSLLLLLLLGSFSLFSAQPNFRFASCNDGDGKYNTTNTYTYVNKTYTYTYTNSSTYVTNLNAFLSFISYATSQTSENRFYYNLPTGEDSGIDRVNGIALCRGDVPFSVCQSCLSNAARKIREVCPNQKEAIVWYDVCMLRYSNSTIFGTVDTSPTLAAFNIQNASDPVVFNKQVGSLLRKLQSEAMAGDSQLKFADGGPARVSDFMSVYAYVECTPDLTGLDCSNCINGLITYIPSCCDSKIGAFIANPSCNIRYEIYQFYYSGNDSLSPPSSPAPTPNATTTTGSSRRRRKAVPHFSLLIALPTLAAILVFSIIWICWRRRKAMQTSNDEIDEEIKDVESLLFDLNTIRTSTHNFSLDNKLGEGGFGEVYKGKLPNGQEIAVKRLSKNSGQGIAEFKTEIVLVAKLQHKNLVKLLGFCLQLKEKILIYEFLPNSSLDRFLFDPTKNMALAWETRFKIILGIARGLLYLHEDSRLKVIHRDLKSSNILLDESMNPKISDFGLAKLFGVDQTQGDTKRIVGTYGYMAPEYAITGHFSVKSDVFSFGVIVLEIVSGQKNRYFARPQLEEALLHRAWRLWNENEVLSLVDPALDNRYPMEEVMKCIHIGLLSVQEDPTERPRMTSIVGALNGDSVSLPTPKAPQFFGNTRQVTEASLSNMNSQALGVKVEMPYTGTKNITDLYPR